MTFRLTRSAATCFWVRTAASMVLLLVAVALSACQPSIELQPSTVRLSPPVATVVPAERSVGIIGVDFDPPLDDARFISFRSLTLLVAIENSGCTEEPRVEVRARLLDPAEAGTPVTLLDETIIVTALVPGELRVVRFPEVQALPPRQRYQLVVEMSGVSGDAVLEDNIRSYDILIRD